MSAQRLAVAIAAMAACGAPAGPGSPPPAAGGYATIGPLRMYYEVHGSGPPVLLIHGGGSTPSRPRGGACCRASPRRTA